MRYHYIPIINRMAKNQSTDNFWLHCQVCGKNKKLSFMAEVWNAKRYSHFGE